MTLPLLPPVRAGRLPAPSPLAGRAGVGSGRPDTDEDTQVLTETEHEVRRPPFFKVILHNDDYTTMDFVIYVLRSVFRLAEGDALRIMLQVHHNGIGVAGVYPYEIAETRAHKAMSLARANEYPLLCTVEPE